MDVLRLKGVKTHNLKDLSLEIPLRRLVCLTGPSGSGKSSLAFDTIYQEGRRRYFEALGLTERGLPQIKPPPLEEAEGLPPAIGLEQKVLPPSPRSTVGTVTGLLEFLRVLFTELGQVKCQGCGKPVRPLPFHEIKTRLLDLPLGTKILVLAPLKEATPGVFRYLQAEGFGRFLIDQTMVDLTEEELPTHFQEAKVVVDRVIIKPDLGPRLNEALRLAAGLTGGIIHVQLLGGEELYFTTKWHCPYCGQQLIEVRKELFSFNHPFGACPLCQGLGEKDGDLCPACKGKRLREESTLVTLGGFDFGTLALKPLKDVKHHLEGLRFSGLRQQIFEGLWAEIKLRLEALEALGLERLFLFQSVSKLSLGERQRLRLAALFGARLSGCLYILDEPGLGLSLAEKEKVLFLIRRLLAQGNSIIMVEHDPWFITSSDWVLELGPGAGEKGGKILFSGPPEDLVKAPDLRTGAFLSGQRRLRRNRRKDFRWLSLALAQGQIQIPQNGLLCLCGSSGAGKTRLLQAIEKALLAQGFAVEVIEPAEGRGQNSIPISYIGAFTPLRELFAGVPEARMRGFRSAHFSFFSKEGRCPGCKGEGQKEIRVPLMPPLRIVCEECGGTRYRRDVLEIRYRGYSIAEVLELMVEEALRLFSRVPSISEKLRLLSEVGLGYLRLGQPLPTLSGGERQRLRLARTLARGKRNFLLLDVPTIGLHLIDIERLLLLFDRLLGEGHTVIVADNHPALVLLADYLLEVEGGKITFFGPPEEWMARERPLAKGYERYRSLVDQG